MAYRQYGQNTARVLGPFTAECVRTAAGLVIGHYDVLFRATPYAGPRADAVERARTRVEEFCGAIARSAMVLERYVNALNELPVAYLWWWCVAHPDLEEIWKS